MLPTDYASTTHYASCQRVSYATCKLEKKISFKNNWLSASKKKNHQSFYIQTLCRGRKRSSRGVRNKTELNIRISGASPLTNFEWFEWNKTPLLSTFSRSTVTDMIRNDRLWFNATQHWIISAIIKSILQFSVH